MHDRLIHARFLGSPSHVTVHIDHRGFGRLDLPSGAVAVSFSAATRHKDQRPEYTVCGPYRQFIPVKDILSRGYVPLDACSPRLKLTAPPGVLLYLIQPLPWYAPARQ